MLPATLDIDMVQGDTYVNTITFVDENGTGIDYSAATFAAQVRPTYKSPNTEMQAFDVNVTNAATGIIVITLLNTQTRTLPTECVWDFQITIGGTPTTLLAGSVNVQRDVTR